MDEPVVRLVVKDNRFGSCRVSIPTELLESGLDWRTDFTWVRAKVSACTRRRRRRWSANKRLDAQERAEEARNQRIITDYTAQEYVSPITYFRGGYFLKRWRY